MGILSNKIDFMMLCTVKNANPNGDPLDGNRPRTTYSGQGEISDVCIKRKIRKNIRKDQTLKRNKKIKRIMYET